MKKFVTSVSPDDDEFKTVHQVMRLKKIIIIITASVNEEPNAAVNQNHFCNKCKQI